MDSAPYLQAEDASDFERILEELLQHDEIRQVLRRAPSAPGTSRLHSLALRDSVAIAAGAAAEYAYYLSVREQVRSTAPEPDLDRLGGDDPAQWQAPENPLDAAERAGWVPLIAVLLPILSGLSAIVMLLLGYILRAEHVALGQPLVMAGFVAAVVCAVAIAVDIIGLLLTAARDAANPPPGRSPDLYAELARARDTWRLALRDQALLPYLLAQIGPAHQPGSVYDRTHPIEDSMPISDSTGDGVSLVRTRPKSTSRLGYSSPGFTSPGPERLTDERGHEVEADPEGEPHFTSPGFTSPGAERISDGQGRDQKADPESEPHFTSPGFTSPGAERISDGQGRDQKADPESEPHYTSPSFTSPGPERLTDERGHEVEPEPEEERHFSSPGWSSGSGRPGPRTAPRPRSRFLPNADDLDVTDLDVSGIDVTGIDAVGEAAETD